MFGLLLSVVCLCWLVIVVWLLLFVGQYVCRLSDVGCWLSVVCVRFMFVVVVVDGVMVVVAVVLVVVDVANNDVVDLCCS